MAGYSATSAPMPNTSAEIIRLRSSRTTGYTMLASPGIVRWAASKALRLMPTWANPIVTANPTALPTSSPSVPSSIAS